MQCQVGLYFCRSGAQSGNQPRLPSSHPCPERPTHFVKFPLDVGSNILLHSELFRCLGRAVERVLLHLLAGIPCRRLAEPNLVRTVSVRSETRRKAKQNEPHVGIFDDGLLLTNERGTRVRERARADKGTGGTHVDMVYNWAPEPRLDSRKLNSGYEDAPKGDRGVIVNKV
jgi:hypothetical protein